MVNKVPFDAFWQCPSCGADFKQEVTQKDGSVWTGSRVIGVEIRGLYDGVAYWICPDCKVVWHRWADSPGNARLRYNIEELWRDQGLTPWRGNL